MIERDIKIICVSSVVWAKSKSAWRYNPLLERNLTLSWSWSHTTFSSLPFSFLLNRASLVAQMVKNLPAMQGDTISIPGSGGGPGEGNRNPLQYSCLENPTDGGAWQATVGHDLATTHTHTHTRSAWQTPSSQSPDQRTPERLFRDILYLPQVETPARPSIICHLLQHDLNYSNNWVSLILTTK